MAISVHSDSSINQQKLCTGLCFRSVVGYDFWLMMSKPETREYASHSIFGSLLSELSGLVKNTTYHTSGKMTSLMTSQ